MDKERIAQLQQDDNSLPPEATAEELIEQAAPKSYDDGYQRYDPESEDALIGALFNTPYILKWPEVAALRPEDFFPLRTRWIWGAVLKLRNIGESIDVENVARQLEDMGRLEDVGGIEALEQLAANCPSSALAASYANKIANKVKDRNRLALAGAIGGSVYRGEDGKVDSLLAENRTDLVGVDSICTTDRSLPELSSQALAALEAYNDPPELFVRSGELSRIQMDERGVPKIARANEAAVRGMMARSAKWYRVRGKKAEHVPAAPPLDVVRDLMALPAWPFPGLISITETPIVHEDGSFFTEPGFDPVSSLYHLPSAEIPQIPEFPHEGDVELAKEVLLEIISEFPFVDESSRANALATIITPVVRSIVEGCTPMALIDKPMPGTGATLLANAVAKISTGRESANLTAPRAEEEWNKEIVSLLREGRTVISIDNVNAKLRSSALSSVLTSTYYSGRQLGANEMVTYPNTAIWIATGNNIKLGGDIPRRCYWIRMDAKLIQPWQRTEFKHPQLIQWIEEERGQILAAILILVRGWILAGKPLASEVPVLGSFETWCKTLGGILEYAGVGGFLGNLEELYKEMDEETPEWEAFLSAWQIKYPGQSVTSKEVAKALKGDEGFFEALPAFLAEHIESKSFTKRLGNALAKKADVWFPCGLRVEKVGSEHRAISWIVKRVS